MFTLFVKFHHKKVRKYLITDPAEATAYVYVHAEAGVREIENGLVGPRDLVIGDVSLYGSNTFIK